MGVTLRLLALLFRKTDQLPVYLIHSVTERCNARCSHCFVYKDGKKDELTVAEIAAFCDTVGKNLYHVCLSGGEPFVRHDLAEIARCYFERTPARVIRISTNGYWPERIGATTEQILRLRSCKNVVVEISFDGIGADHDAIRQLPGLFTKAVETFHKLKQLEAVYRHFRVNVNVTVCASNQDRLPALYDYLTKTLGIQNISMTLTRGRPEDVSELGVDIGNYERFAKLVEEDLGEQRLAGYAGIARGFIVNAQNILARRRILATIKDPRFRSRCYAGNLAGVLLSDGLLRPCELRPEVLGNIRDRPFPELWRSKEADTFKQTCDHCFCTHECFLASNIIFNKRHAPALVGLASRMWLSSVWRRLVRQPAPAPVAPLPAAPSGLPSLTVLGEGGACCSSAPKPLVAADRAQPIESWWPSEANGR
ncbi:MAG: radical SAM protein [Isosphaeraceae bacterium]|nr:radical SAM protein [Isosphaeraceae bacterium]